MNTLYKDSYDLVPKNVLIIRLKQNSQRDAVDLLKNRLRNMIDDNGV